MRQIIERIGMDKVAHFGVGGLITALVTLVAIVQDLDILTCEPWRVILYPLIGTFVTAVVSVIKEVAVDYERDWWDLYAALIGSVLVFVASAIGLICYSAS